MIIETEAFMESVLANCSASISELKKNPSALIDEAQGCSGSKFR